jgi:glycerol-3-phosphate dehydrogenase
MKIAVIGSGNVGSAVAKGAQSAGHDVVVTSAGGDMSNAEAVRGADIVVLAVPYGAVSEIAAEIAGEVRGATIVDATNPLTDDYSGLVTEGGASGAERIQQQLPGAKVVKASIPSSPRIRTVARWTASNSTGSSRATMRRRSSRRSIFSRSSAFGRSTRAGCRRRATWRHSAS